MAAHVDPLLGPIIYMALLVLGLLALAILREIAGHGGGSRRHGSTAVLWVKSPTEFELRRARLAKTGELLVVDGKETWVYRPPAEYRPVELRVGGRVYKTWIVDKSIHSFYEVPELRGEELEQEVEVGGRRVKLNRVMLDPRTLFNYIGSKSMEKLIRPLKVGKAEAVGYMAIGGVLVLVMIFFMLPLLGYPVRIGG